MIDWVAVAKSSLWVGGLSGVLAALSYASFGGGRSARPLRITIRQPSVRLCFLVSSALASAGVLVTASSAWDALLRVALLCLAGVGAWVLLRTRPAEDRNTPGPSARARLSAQRDAGDWRPAAAWLVRVEPWLLLVATPVLMFPSRITVLLLPLLLVPMTARKLTQGRLTLRTPMDWPIVILLVLLPISLRVSPDLSRSLPKLYGIVLGVAAFYGVVNHELGARQAWMSGLALALLGAAVSAFALVGTDWHVGWLSVKSPVPEAIYRYFPTLIRGVPGAAELGFHPNEVGAALCLFAPLTASLLLLGLGPLVAGSVKSRQWLLQGALALALGVMLATAILTGSRSTWLGLAIALCVVLALRYRRAALGLFLLVIVLVVWCVSSLRPELGPAMLPALQRDLAWREEIWASALAMIRDSPWTGVGLNAFPLVANASYPLRSFTQQEVLQLTHAHNVFLQVAVDLGIPGLVAYMAILVGFAGAAYSVYRRCQSRQLRAVVVGLACSMLGYHIYGLTDCMTLGAKPGLLIWVMWGLMAAMANLPSPGGRVVTVHDGLVSS